MEAQTDENDLYLQLNPRRISQLDEAVAETVITCTAPRFGPGLLCKESVLTRREKQVMIQAQVIHTETDDRNPATPGTPEVGDTLHGEIISSIDGAANRFVVCCGETFHRVTLRGEPNWL